MHLARLSFDFLALAVPLGASLIVSCACLADAYPTRPIRFIVPNGYGGDRPRGALDRAEDERGAGRADRRGQPAGVGGIVGTEMVARSPDGYTLLMGTIGNLAISPHLYKKLAYDPLRDFAAVTQLAASAYVLVVHPAVPAQSVREFVALAKAKPGAMNYASAGSGTGSHLTMELFKSVTGTEVVHIPYRGGTAGLTEVLEVTCKCASTASLHRPPSTDPEAAAAGGDYGQTLGGATRRAHRGRSRACGRRGYVVDGARGAGRDAASNDLEAAQGSG